MRPAATGAPPELVCEALGRRLAALADAPLFGLAGSGNLELIAAFQGAGGTYHAARHEAGAVAMADGWAQASGHLGLATVHQGPGLTNALTALVDSAKARTPLLVVAGEVARSGGLASQWIDQAQVLGGLGAGIAIHRLDQDARIADLLHRLLRQARRERRPVVLLAPVELQTRLTPGDEGRPPDPSSGREEEVAALRIGDVAALAERLREARRPVLLAGRGAVLAGAGPELEALAERIGAILTTTAPAHGLFAGNAFATGIAGGFASPLTTRLLGEADVVLACGASLGAWTTCDGRLFAQARVERIDADADASGVSVAGDVRIVAWELLKRLPACRAEGWRTDELRDEIAAFRRADALPETRAGSRVHPGVLCAELDRRLPAQRCYVLDSGHFAAWPAMLSSVSEPGAFLFGQAFQAVGLGLARAIGAAVARPDRLTVALVGDGGMMMALGELDTAARLGVPLLAVVFDDAAYGAEVHDFAPLGVAVDAARFPDRDLAAVAGALGCSALTMTSLADLDVVERWCARPDGPLLVDAKIEPYADAVTLMTPLGAADWSPAPRPTRGPA